MSRNLADEVRRFRRGKRNTVLERSIEMDLEQSQLFLESILAGPNTRPDEMALHAEMLSQLAAAIAALPLDQSRVVVLHYFENKTATEIGRELGKTEIAVAGLLRRGLQRLREILRQSNE